MIPRQGYCTVVLRLLLTSSLPAWKAHAISITRSWQANPVKMADRFGILCSDTAPGSRGTPIQGGTPVITMTEAARRKIAEIMEARGQHGCALRLQIVGRGVDEFKYDLRFVETDSVGADDTMLDMEQFRVAIDPGSAPNLAGTVIDFRVLDDGGGGLLIDNPNPVWTDPTSRTVAAVVEKHINPGVRAHGGNVNLIDVKDGVVTITMSGGCQGCGLAAMTLRYGIEQMIREAVPSIREVVDVTEHAAGKNPFFPSEPDGRAPSAKRED